MVMVDVQAAGLRKQYSEMSKAASSGQDAMDSDDDDDQEDDEGPGFGQGGGGSSSTMMGAPAPAHHAMAYGGDHNGVMSMQVSEGSH